MESNDAVTTVTRAQELRASLGARREVETMLAEASAVRQAAATAADALVEEAQQLSEQLLSESADVADRTTADARERAEELLTRARADAEEITRQARVAADEVRARAEAQVEEHRRRVRAELTEQVTHEVREQGRRELLRVREQSHAMIGDLEASVRILGVSLEASTTSISEMLAALDELRAHTVESLGAPDAPSVGSSSRVEPWVESPTSDSPILDDPAPSTSVPTARPVAPRRDDDADPPLTATEAFLRSSHLDHDDPPLPPLTDAEVGARYAQEARTRAGEGARKTAREDVQHVKNAERPEAVAHVEDTDAAWAAEDADDVETGDPAGRALGWLFRASP